MPIQNRTIGRSRRATSRYHGPAKSTCFDLINKMRLGLGLGLRPDLNPKYTPEVNQLRVHNGR